MKNIVYISILFIVGFFSGVLLLESGMRVVLGNPCKVLKNAPNYYYDYEIYNNFFRKTTNSLGQEVYKSQRSRCRSSEFLADKPKNIKRIFIVGESVAQMFGDRSKKKLEKALNAQFPDYQYEIINCGTGGYDSNRILLIFKEISEYSPDFVLVLMGNNGASEILKLNRYLVNQHLRYFYENSWVCRKMINILRGKKKHKIQQAVNVLKSNFAKILEISKAKSIQPVLFTIPANMRDFPPTRSEYSETDIAAAKLKMDENKNEAALKIFADLLKNKDRKKNPYIYFYIAKCFDNMSQYKKAKEMYYKAIDIELGGRRPGEINDIVRESGKKEGYMVVDIEKIFSQFSSNELLGYDFFQDHCHWRGAYDVLIIQGILKELRRFSGKGPVVNLNVNRLEQEINRKAVNKEVDREILYESTDNFYNVFNAFIMSEGVSLHETFVSRLKCIYPKCGNKFKNASGLKNRVLEHLRSNIWQPGQIEELTKNWNVVLWHIGEACRQMKNCDLALEYFNASINIKSDDINAYYFRGMTYYMLKEYQKAGSDWDIVVKKDEKYNWLKDLEPFKPIKT